MIKGKKITDAASDDSAASLQTVSKNESRSRELGAYFVRACLLVVIVYLLSLALPKMPSSVVALFWVAFTIVSMLGILYQASIAKANKQQKYVSGGMRARVNNGRVGRLVLSFAASAVFMASLLLEAPKWDVVEWTFIAAAVVVYPLVEFILRRRAPYEFEPIFQTAGILFWTCIIVGSLLCAGYAAFSLLSGGASGMPADITVLDALAKTPQPLENASSALIQEAGIGSWLIDSIVNYGLTQLSQFPRPVCIFIRVALCAGAFFGVTNLLGVCSLSARDLRKAFIPTDAIKSDDSNAPIKKPYVVLTVVLSLMLAGVFLFCDAKMDAARKSETGTALQSIARQLAGKSFYFIDGKYYDQVKIDDLAKSINQARGDFLSASLGLEQSIDSVYDSCEGNIDSFLDWYFSIATNGAVRQGIPKDGVEQTLKDKFEATIAPDEDESITQKVKDYRQAAHNLQARIEAGYSDAEIDGERYKDLPEWFLESKEFTDAADLELYRQQAKAALEALDESGASNALDQGNTLLGHFFEVQVYSNDPFKKWVEATGGIAGDGNIALDVIHYAQGMYDQTKRDEYRSAIQAQLDECKKQTRSLVPSDLKLV